MSPTPRRRRASDKSEEQIHYESLANYLKYVVGIAGGLIVVLASVAIFVSYGDRQSMNNENDKLRSDFKNQMIEMRSEANQSRQELEDRYNNELDRFDKSIIDMKADAMQRQTSLDDRYNKQIEDLKVSSKDQVTSIVSETRNAATQQTQREISAILQTDRVQKIIEQNAIGELKDKLPSVMAAYMRDLPQILESANWFDGGAPEGADRLRDLMKSESEFTREIAKRLYEKIVNKFVVYADTINDIEYKRILREVGVGLPLHVITQNTYPNDPTDAKNLEALIKVIRNQPIGYMYFQVSPAAKALSFISGRRFDFMDKEEIYKWYNNLKRSK